MRIEQMEYSAFSIRSWADGISYALILESEVSMLDLIEERGWVLWKVGVTFGPP